MRRSIGHALHHERTIAFLPVAAFLCVYALWMPPLFFNDTWLAILGGQEIFHHGLPHTEHWVAWAAGRSWVDQQWLGQVIFFGAHKLDGYFGAWALGGACMGGAIGLLGAALRRSGLDVVRGAPIVVGLAAAMFPFAYIRTQSIAYLWFAIVVYLLIRAEEDWRWSWLTLPILVLWANTHGSALLGAVLVVTWAACGVIRAESAAARKRLAALMVLAGVTPLITPYGTDILDYYSSILGKPGVDAVSGEWAPTALSLDQTNSYAFFVALAAYLLLLGGWWRRVRLYEWVWLALTFYLALRGVRFQVWFLLLGAVILVRVWLREEIRNADAEVPPVHAAIAGVLACLLPVLILYLALSPASRYVGHTRARSLAVVRGYVERHPGSRLLGLAPQVDFYMWELPALRGRALVDARVELLTKHELRSLVKFAGGAEGWPELLRRERVGIVTGNHNYRGTLRRLRRIGWKKLYDHHGTFVVARP